jgi:hypothetical protein
MHSNVSRRWESVIDVILSVAQSSIAAQRMNIPDRTMDYWDNGRHWTDITGHDDYAKTKKQKRQGQLMIYLV